MLLKIIVGFFYIVILFAKMAFIVIVIFWNINTKQLILTVVLMVIYQLIRYFYLLIYSLFFISYSISAY